MAECIKRRPGMIDVLGGISHVLSRGSSGIFVPVVNGHLTHRPGKRDGQFTAGVHVAEQDVGHAIAHFRAQQDSACPLCERILSAADAEVLIRKYTQDYEKTADFIAKLIRKNIAVKLMIL